MRAPTEPACRPHPHSLLRVPGRRSLRAFREAQALAAAGPSQLLVACHGAWMEGELYYAKMEFCAGGSLGAALRKGMTAEAAPFSAAEAGTASDLQPTPMRQRPHVSRVAELAGADPVRGRLFGGPADLPGPTPTESPTARGPGQAASAHALGIVEPAVLTVVAQTALVRAVDSPSPCPFTLTLARSLLQALHHLHTRGIAHLDVKPDNILLEDDLPPSVWRMDGASPGSAEATPSPPSRFGAAHDAASPLAAPMPAIGLSPQPPAPGSGATTPMGASSPGAPFTHGTLPPTDSAGRRAHGHLGTAALPRIRIKLGDLGQAASLDGTIDREEGDGRYMPRCATSLPQARCTDFAPPLTLAPPPLCVTAASSRRTTSATCAALTCTRWACPPSRWCVVAWCMTHPSRSLALPLH